MFPSLPRGIILGGTFILLNVINFRALLEPLSQQSACFSTSNLLSSAQPLTIRRLRVFLRHIHVRARVYVRARARVEEGLPGQTQASNSLSRRSPSLIARSDRDNHSYRVSNAVGACPDGVEGEREGRYQWLPLRRPVARGCCCEKRKETTVKRT